MTSIVCYITFAFICDSQVPTVAALMDVWATQEAGLSRRRVAFARKDSHGKVVIKGRLRLQEQNYSSDVTRLDATNSKRYSRRIRSGSNSYSFSLAENDGNPHLTLDEVILGQRELNVPTVSRKLKDDL